MKQAMLERSVIASVIMGDALPSLLGLEQTHFSDPLCAQLFRTMTRMERERREIGLVSVCMADETLDAQAVVSLSQEHCISGVILEQHCALLRERSIRRRLEAMLAEALSALKAGAQPLEQAQALAGRFSQLFAGAAEDVGVTMLEVICRIFEQIEGRREEKPPVASGIEAIDQCLSGGFRPGDLAVIAALTSVGKSAMLAFMMRNAAEQGRRILLISCEMSEEQNAERFLASISGVELDKFIRRQKLSDEENVAVSEGMDRYHPENIRLISSGTQTVSSVRREALRMKASGGLDLIVVDYLQRLRPDAGRANKSDEVGAIASGLKSMAVDLDVPVLTAAQFNREAARGRSEARGNENVGVPALHQLRDSSQIEDEANTVIILDEPKRKPGEGVRRINAYVVKNRSGALRAAKLRFDPQKMVYEPDHAD